MLFVRIVIVLILFVLSAFFSGSETAIFSLSRHNVDVLMTKNRKKTRYLSMILNHPDKILISILIGNMIVNTFAASISTKIFSDLIFSSGPIISFFVVTLIILIFGEIMPKIYAINNSRESALFSIKKIVGFSYLVYPLILLFNYLTNLVKSISGRFIKKIKWADLTGAHIRELINKEAAGIDIDDFEKRLLENLFEFPEIYVSEIMVPRNEIFAIPERLTYSELLERIKASEFSNIPVYRDKFENIIGIFNVKNLLSLNPDKGFDLEPVLEVPIFLPERIHIYSLFEKMRKQKFNVAFVVDEYGGLSGLVTLEDIIEEIVGEIYNKGKEEVKIEKISENSFITYGRLELSKLNDFFSLNSESEMMETLGGLITEKLERFPNLNEEVEIGNILFKVLEIKRGKIGKILIKKI
jgi:putative hemolysin